MWLLLWSAGICSVLGLWSVCVLLGAVTSTVFKKGGNCLEILKLPEGRGCLFNHTYTPPMHVFL